MSHSQCIFSHAVLQPALKGMPVRHDHDYEIMIVFSTGKLSEECTVRHDQLGMTQ